VLLDVAIDVLKPIMPVRPSEWIEDNIVISALENPDRPGKFRCDYLPWIRDLLDLLYEEPGKFGMIIKKPGQVGITTSMLAFILCQCATNPGPFLFLISKDKQASHFADSKLDPLIEGSDVLREVFADTGGARDLMTEKPFRGGRVDFAGAGSVDAVMSRPYRIVAIDEYEVVEENYPAKKAGNMWQHAETRGERFRESSLVITWSHPRKKGEGLDKLQSDLSHIRPYVFDCPHCHDAIRPLWKDVVFTRRIDDAPDPYSAELRCPSCGVAISDADRARVGRSVHDGGTARFAITLDPDEAAKRRYIGPCIHRFCDTSVSIVSLAVKFVVCKTDEQLMGFYNATLGEEYTSSQDNITVDLVAERVHTMESIAVPAGRLGCQYLCTGIDVQAPQDNPTMYAWSAAFATTGDEHVVDLVKLKGWTALAEYLRQLYVPTYDDESGEVLDQVLPCRLCTIDCGYMTSQVLDFCRTNIISAVGNNRIQLLPVRYSPHIKSDCPEIGRASCRERV